MKDFFEMALPAEGGVAAAWRQALLGSEENPADDEFLLSWHDVRFMCRGDLVSVKGKSKVGKTFAIVMLVAAYLKGEVDGICRAADLGTVLWIDTEQRRNSTLRALQRLRVLVDDKELTDNRLAIANVRRYNATMRFEILRYAIQSLQPALIVIDNVADLMECMDYNNNAEAARTLAELSSLSEERGCTILCSIHENSNNDNASGWLGRILLQKCGLEFTVKKEKGHRTLCATACRDAEVEEIPFNIVATADGVLVPHVTDTQTVPADQRCVRYETQFGGVEWGNGLQFGQLIGELVRLHGNKDLKGEASQRQYKRMGMYVSRAVKDGYLCRSNDQECSLYLPATISNRNPLLPAR